MFRNVRFYYVSKHGQDTELPRDVTGASLGVFGENYGTSYFDDKGLAISYQTYIVGTPAERRDWGTAREVVLRAIADWDTLSR